eukprot:c17997_g1_i2.p1 GENE.c17997_g1_i2~~c17997_g1_i2.p1  ORF type:complete len:315 (+),score=64.11 c17997_g1_i2:49-993(+)
MSGEQPSFCRVPENHQVIGKFFVKGGTCQVNEAAVKIMLAEPMSGLQVVVDIEGGRVKNNCFPHRIPVSIHGWKVDAATGHAFTIVQLPPFGLKFASSSYGREVKIIARLCRIEASAAGGLGQSVSSDPAVVVACVKEVMSQNSRNHKNPAKLTAESPCSELKNVGPTYGQRLKTVNIHTLRDLAQTEIPVSVLVEKIMARQIVHAQQTGLPFCDFQSGNYQVVERIGAFKQDEPQEDQLVVRGLLTSSSSGAVPNISSSNSNRGSGVQPGGNRSGHGSASAGLHTIANDDIAHLYASTIPQPVLPVIQHRFIR